MALDTASKRAAAIGVGMPPGVILPPPDGTIDAADRAALSGVVLPSAADALEFIGPSIPNLSLTHNQVMAPRNYAGYFVSPNPITYTLIGTPPTGVSLSSAGVLSGTPTDLGPFPGLAVRADDGVDTVDSNTFSITVAAASSQTGITAPGITRSRITAAEIGKAEIAQ